MNLGASDSKASQMFEKIDNDNLHEFALQIARRCRQIIQGCLREEEWHDADEEFCAVILAELRQLQERHGPRASTKRQGATRVSGTREARTNGNEGRTAS